MVLALARWFGFENKPPDPEELQNLRDRVDILTEEMESVRRRPSRARRNR